MAVTPSTMPPLGTVAKSIVLNDYNGKRWEINPQKDNSPTLVMFICNHCPYVKHLFPKMAEITTEIKKMNIGVYAVNSNDPKQYPEDGVDEMKITAKKYNLNFPYLVDTTQEIAKAYTAACTPDFFLFDNQGRLYYRGQLDSSRPGSSMPINGKDLLNAATLMCDNQPPPDVQLPSIGCNIKWKPQQ